MNKSTVEEIRERFDHDVERFSNLETGQVATIDAQVSLELITEAAKRINPTAKNLLDIGCGAGNYSLKMLSKLPNLNCTLVDLSKPMLDRAIERVSSQTSGEVNIMQDDIRHVDILRPGGCLMIADLVLQDMPVLNAYTWERYGDYLKTIGGEEYKIKVLNYVEKEDSPRSLNFQLDLMKRVGFRHVEILHKNICFAAYGGIK